ncbi:MAG: DUF5667 domain-containing protein [Candidatus Bathyarchaeota archaeon]
MIEKIIAALIGFLILASPVLAQSNSTSDQLGVNPGILPDSPFYGLKGLYHNIQLFFTTDPAERAKLHYAFAEENLAEAYDMSSKGKMKLAMQSGKLYETELGRSNVEEEKAIAFGRNMTLLADHVNNNTYKHILVLQEVLSKSASDEKGSMQRIINFSIVNQAEMVGRLEDKNLVNISITVGNETRNYTLPAKFVSKFIEKSEKVQERNTIRIENKEKLVLKIENKTQERVDEAQKSLDELRAQLNNTNSTADISIMLNQAQNHLDRAKVALNESKYGEAWGQATSSLNMIKNAEKMLERYDESYNRTQKSLRNETENKVRNEKKNMTSNESDHD